jgi:hypothetical protein
VIADAAPKRSVLYAIKRWMYRTGRPNWLARAMNRVSAVQFARGFLAPSHWVTLQVRGRRSGRLISFPLVLTEYDGERSWWPCSARTRTGFTTYGPRAAAPPCATGVRRRYAWWRSNRLPAHPSCVDTWRSLPAPGPTCRSGAAPRWRRSSASPRTSRSSWCGPPTDAAESPPAPGAQ